MALIIEGLILTILGIFIILAETIFKMSFIIPLHFIAYAIIFGVVGIKLSVIYGTDEQANLIKLA